ncbi:hypothetical protein CspeluHIS016_0902970 [Cutaneotrichosporon spelunceum]|uniref:Uncharacterized protein n=1 Tax=Cutaneotrichosporon spelunceum TaxID=1672016 RepID=A0AAD3YEB0_9TREE|nr:hypothetical protein CspeluHIS016_0902970 [Cutaneotrichosporon spelunceum]
MTEDPSEYFDAAADAFLQQYLPSTTKLLFRIVYHTAAIVLGLRIAKWYFDHTRPLADQRFAYLFLSAVGAVPFVVAVPLYGLVASYIVRRGINLLSRSLSGLLPGSQSRSVRSDFTIPLLAAIGVLTFALLWQSATPPPQNLTSPNPLLSPFPMPARPQFDATVLRYELHADVQATVQMHLTDIRRELVAQSQSHAKAMSELQAQVRQLQEDLETLQSRSVAASLQNAVDACSVAKVAELAAAAVKSSSFFLIILMLPSVLYFGFIHGFLATVATYIVSIWKLLYPADPSARRAYALRMVAQAAIILQLSLYLLGYRFPINTRLKWGGAWLVGALVIALLPIHYTILLGAPIRACSRIANHLRTHATYYILTIGGIGSGVGVYYLIVHVNGIVETDRHQMYDPFRLHKQILAELEELRAEVQALRQT